MNIILISVDALRRDKVGAYFNIENSLTPNIDSLAKNGSILDNHFTVLNGSTPVQISMFTGLYPSKHGVHENGYKLPDKFRTLAEYLSENGYTTCGMVSSGAISSAYNFNKGFNQFYDNSKYDRLMFWARKAGTKRYNIRKFLRDIAFKKFGLFDIFTRTYDKTNKTALKWLDNNYKNKFFLYVHFFDIHEDTYGERTKSKDVFKNYDENVKIIDSAIGKLIDKVKELNVFDDTMFIITADHGEDLSEHLEKTQHGRKISEDEFRIPCIIYKPGLIPTKRVNNLTRVIDLLPTILDLNGINLQQNIDGVSIKKSIFEDVDLVNDAFLEAYPLYGDLKGVKTKEWLYILKNGKDEELYNTKIDEKLKNNLANENKDLCLEFKMKVKDHFSIEYKPGERDEYTKEMLARLGYVE